MKYKDILEFVNTKREYIGDEDYEELKRIINNLTLKENNKLAQIKHLGDLEFRKGNYSKSIEWYTAYLDLNKENYLIYSNRAAAYHKLSMVEEAINDCEVGLILSPTFSKFYLRLGLLTQSKDIEKSLEYFQRGLEVDSDNSLLIKQLEIVKSQQKVKN